MIRLMLRSLAYYWRSHLGVFGGTLLAAAVLTGALLVGDSVNYSLQTFATLRLGGVHHALDTRGQLIAEALAPRLEQAAGAPAVSALHLRGMALSQPQTGAESTQINNVQVIGVEERFWAYGQGTPVALGPHETALNSKLAHTLGVREGDAVSLRVAKPSLMARDSPLSSREEDRSIRNRYTVRRVLSDEEMGRFGLTPSQIAPYNAFVSLPFLQTQVEQQEKINLVLLGEAPVDRSMDQVLKQAWQLRDIGLSLRTCSDGVVQLESERLFLNEETAQAALSIPEARGTLTYLATSLAKGNKLTPYFFVVAGALREQLGENDMVINRWMANELRAGVGDAVTLTYTQLLPSNKFEDASRGFTVRGIVEMESLAAEKERMPIFPGLSDVESCSDWDVGMPMDDVLLNDKANEEYWETWRETPKAFVSLKAGQEMWSNRFGKLTAVRFPPGTSVPELEGPLRNSIDPAQAGLYVAPVREQALRAVAEAMDFGGLFLGMSCFLIVAALVLTALLFVFGVQQRASQMGILGAVGFRPRQIRLLLLGEGLLIAAAGAAAGAAFGTLYTRALLHGLGQYWRGAVANATLYYHAEPATVIIGAVSTLLCAFCAMTLAVRKLSGQTPRDLLNLDFTQASAVPRERRHVSWGLYVPLTLLALAVAAIVYAFAGEEREVAFVFFGAGTLSLLAGIGLFRNYLVSLAERQFREGERTREPVETRRILSFRGHATGSRVRSPSQKCFRNKEVFGLRNLALLNLTRRPGRSLAVVGVLSSGCFLVFAVSAMQEDLEAHASARASGTGGFAILAESTFPVLDVPHGLVQAPDVSDTAIKVRDGDDASCLNLNKAQTPRLLGVDPKAFASRGAFTGEDGAEAFWRQLDEPLPGGEIPAFVGDANTAMWTLKKKVGREKGDVLIYKDESGVEVPIKLIGTLPVRLSVFQGSLLISQEAFTRLFPAEDGHRLFLLDAPLSKQSGAIEALRKQYDRFGMDAMPAVERLREYAVVESTYLAMFLVLGGLGMVIGSVGMAVVVLRNLFERRAEIAMLAALGFSSALRRRAYLLEFGLLLLAGLGIGGVSAGIALLPALSSSQTALSTGTLLGMALLVLIAYAGCLALALFVPLRNVDFAALRSE